MTKVARIFEEEKLQALAQAEEEKRLALAKAEKDNRLALAKAEEDNRQALAKAEEKLPITPSVRSAAWPIAQTNSL